MLDIQPITNCPKINRERKFTLTEIKINTLPSHPKFEDLAKKKSEIPLPTKEQIVEIKGINFNIFIEENGKEFAMENVINLENQTETTKNSTSKNEVKTSEIKSNKSLAWRNSDLIKIEGESIKSSSKNITLKHGEIKYVGKIKRYVKLLKENEIHKLVIYKSKN